MTKMARFSALLLSVLTCACEDTPVCGPLADSATRLTATIDQSEVVWEHWRSSPNNDCGESGGPISLTLEADQQGSNRGLTLCLPRPDRLSGTVEGTDTSRLQIIDVFADLEGDCLATLDRTQAIQGSVDFHGVCSDGQHAGGFSMLWELALPVTVTCGDNSTAETMNFSGMVRVEATALP